jgi:hypothetical protein
VNLLILIVLATVISLLAVFGPSWLGMLVRRLRDAGRRKQDSRDVPPPPSAWTVMAWTDDNVDLDGIIRHATVYGPFHGVEGFMIAQRWSDLVEGLRPKRYKMEIILQPIATITNSPLEVKEWPEYETLN